MKCFCRGTTNAEEATKLSGEEGRPWPMQWMKAVADYRACCRREREKTLLENDTGEVKRTTLPSAREEAQQVSPFSRVRARCTPLHCWPTDIM